jgi:glutaminyl-tRNA synthetase
MANEKPGSEGESEGSAEGTDFIRETITADVSAGKNDGRVVTRFPPHPNGYLHIGHAFAINTNFGIAAENGGVCNLRFDDTNPEAEDPEYVEAIQRDIRWLGFDWEDRLYHASDYFEKLYGLAEGLVNKGLAYVCACDEESIRKQRGNFYEPGVDCEHRNRPDSESLDLLRRMRAGEFEDGSHVLRARIDMQSADLNMRDPLMYRIKHIRHERLGDAWPIYPMYDFSHGLSDSLEGITHSLCSLEFLDHRPLYDWFLEACEMPNRPQQIEFARINVNYTVTSKRVLTQLVSGGHVEGWDDPRMPTVSGMRRRGYPAEAIRRFCSGAGITRRGDTITEVGRLEHAVRDQLNNTSPRVLAVLRPVKLVIENYPEDRVDELDAPHHPNDESFGTRPLPLSRELWVERDDWLDDPPKKWHRLGPGREVRLKYACLITCERAIRDEAGEITEIRCRWDPDSLGGAPADGRKVRGTIHWVSAQHAIDAEVRLYDRLFSEESPLADDREFTESLNPDSLDVISGCKLEPGLASAQPGDQFQFERQGYFCRDTGAEGSSYIMTVGLRDAWAKKAK